MQSAKGALRRLLPASLRTWLWYWRSRDLRQSLAAAKRVRKQLGCRVFQGPFAGMDYVEHAIGSCYTPKLIGTYEKELWPVIDEIITKPYDTVIDIGAAEGYYAIGLARRLPSARVIAFEAQTQHHALLLNLARRNGVHDRVTLRGLCGPDDLAACLTPRSRTLILSDCEGAERELLNPDQTTALANADLLVEEHDC
jgi:hypothetical protein